MKQKKLTIVKKNGEEISKEIGSSVDTGKIIELLFSANDANNINIIVVESNNTYVFKKTNNDNGRKMFQRLSLDEFSNLAKSHYIDKKIMLLFDRATENPDLGLIKYEQLSIFFFNYYMARNNTVIIEKLYPEVEGMSLGIENIYGDYLDIIYGDGWSDLIDLDN